jgi:hypothetical protein
MRCLPWLLSDKMLSLLADLKPDPVFAGRAQGKQASATLLKTLKRQTPQGSNPSGETDAN